MTKSVVNEDKQPSHKIYDVAVVALIVVGLIVFYAAPISELLKWIVFIACLIGSGALFFFKAPTGINLHGYFRDSYRELQKVVWPTSSETRKMTLIVFGFVVVLGLFLWAVDSGLAWLLYGVVLGKGS